MSIVYFAKCKEKNSIEALSTLDFKCYLSSTSMQCINGSVIEIIIGSNERKPTLVSEHTHTSRCDIVLYLFNDLMRKSRSWQIDKHQMVQNSETNRNTTFQGSNQLI